MKKGKLQQIYCLLALEMEEDQLLFSTRKKPLV